MYCLFLKDFSLESLCKDPFEDIDSNTCAFHSLSTGNRIDVQIMFLIDRTNCWKKKGVCGSKPD